MCIMLGRKPQRKETSRALGVGGRIKKIGYKGEERFHLAQNRFLLRAFVNTVMNLRVPYRARNFLTS